MVYAFNMEIRYTAKLMGKRVNVCSSINLFNVSYIYIAIHVYAIFNIVFPMKSHPNFVRLMICIKGNADECVRLFIGVKQNYLVRKNLIENNI